MTDLCILCEDIPFSRLLCLWAECEGKTAVAVAREEALPPARLYLVDADRFSPPEISGAEVVLFGTRGKENIWQRPFSPALLSARLRSPAPAERAGEAAGRAVFRERLLSLSPVEARLFAALREAGGAPIASAALFSAVWGERAFDHDLLRVTVHHLKRKLEADGRRAIYAVRGFGYCLKEGGADD